MADQAVDLNAGNMANYGYWPSLSMSLPMISLFLVSTIWHTLQCFTGKYRWRVMLVMTVGGIIECVGWGGRIWSDRSEFQDGFLVQIICLTLAPTLYSAALYLLLGHIIRHIDPTKSRLTFKQFEIIFITADFISLAIQGGGGGLAATALTLDELNRGSNIMLVGIVFQLLVMLIFTGYWIVFVVRAWESVREASRNVHQLMFGMIICTFGVILRGGYRTAELSEGFTGRLASDQGLFLLDAVPIVIATYGINFFHPNRLTDLKPRDEDGFDFASGQELNSVTPVGKSPSEYTTVKFNDSDGSVNEKRR